MRFLLKKRENACFHLPGIQIVLLSSKRYADPQHMKIIENKNFWVKIFGDEKHEH